MNATSPATTTRGFFVIAHGGPEGEAAPVCNGGDAFHLHATERRDHLIHFSALSQPISAAGPVHFFDTSSLGMLPGTHEFALTLTLVETSPWRGHEITAHNEAALKRPTLLEWLTTRRCVGQRVPLSSSRVVSLNFDAASPIPEPECTSLPTAPGQYAYVKSESGEAGAGAGGVESSSMWCIGNATRRLHDTANAVRRMARSRQGFRHVLKPMGCRLRLYGEQRLARCLRGRSVLLMGSTFSVDIRKGLARLNSTLGAWTRQPPGPVHPNVADFWRAFEKPSGSYCYRGGRDRPCAITFGHSVVSTQLFHYPSYRGLSNLKGAHYDAMCEHDIVLVESAAEDFALPPSSLLPLRASSRLLRACNREAVHRGSGARVACAAAAVAATQNKSWRLDPWAQYSTRLAELLARWRACRNRRPPGSWHPIFLLSPAPRAVRHAADCEMGLVRGMGSLTHQRASINALARRMVESSGFDVFDPFAITLHAPVSWWDRERTPLEYAAQEAEAVSDMLTQFLLNHLCKVDVGGSVATNQRTEGGGLRAQEDTHLAATPFGRGLRAQSADDGSVVRSFSSSLSSGIHTVCEAL